MHTKKPSLGSLNSREVVEQPILRKPFSPISSTVSSQTNMAQLPNDANKAQSEVLQKPVLPNNNIGFTTPLKTTSILMDEENKTPKTMPIPPPATPSTVSIPMQTAMTPAPQSLAAAVVVDEIPEEIEYSFEERRAGFVVARAHIKSLIHV